MFKVRMEFLIALENGKWLGNLDQQTATTDTQGA